MQGAGWLPPMMKCFGHTLMAPPLSSDGLTFETLRIGDQGPVFVADPDGGQRMLLVSHWGDKHGQVKAGAYIGVISAIQYLVPPLVAMGVVDGFQSIWCLWFLLYFYVGIILSLVFAAVGSYSFAVLRWGRRNDEVLCKEFRQPQTNKEDSTESVADTPEESVTKPDALAHDTTETRENILV